MAVTYRGFDVTELSVCGKTGECFVTVVGMVKDQEGFEYKKTKTFGISSEKFDILRKRINNLYEVNN